jgi:prepilin-type N-terminal cleavage/methylation domain-containing protein
MLFIKVHIFRRTVLKKGFSLIEILIVVVILGIAGMMAIPMIGSASSVQVDAAADTIASDLGYAKNMAITNQKDYWAVFDSDSYQLEDADGVIMHPVNKKDYVIEYSSLGSGITVTTNFTDDKVKFEYMGSPDSGGTVTIQGSTVSKTVTVEPVTGYISVE